MQVLQCRIFATVIFLSTLIQIAKSSSSDGRMEHATWDQNGRDHSHWSQAGVDCEVTGEALQCYVDRSLVHGDQTELTSSNEETEEFKKPLMWRNGGLLRQIRVGKFVCFADVTSSKPNNLEHKRKVRKLTEDNNDYLEEDCKGNTKREDQEDAACSYISIINDILEVSKSYLKYS